MIFDLFIYAPLIITLLVWLRIIQSRQWPNTIGVVSLAIATANSIFAVWNFLSYHSKTYSAPPWKDPEILNFGLLFLAAPVAMIASCFAAARGTPKWVIVSIWIASVPLLLIGFLAAASV
jgi:hypothetical protein